MPPMSTSVSDPSCRATATADPVGDQAIARTGAWLSAGAGSGSSSTTLPSAAMMATVLLPFISGWLAKMTATCSPSGEGPNARISRPVTTGAGGPSRGICHRSPPLVK